MRYPVSLTSDDNGTFLVTCPVLPEVTSFGTDKSDALVRARDAVLTAFDARIEYREVIPLSHFDEGLQIDLSSRISRKIHFHNLMIERDLNQEDVARLLEIDRAQVAEFLNLDHNTQMDRLEAAFCAIR